MSINAFLRQDGRKGIRNVIVVAYLVECAHHVSREIVFPFRDRDVHLIGFPGCYPNDYAAMMLERLTTHPNVGAVLLVSLGCEGFDRGELARKINAGSCMEIGEVVRDLLRWKMQNGLSFEEVRLLQTGCNHLSREVAIAAGITPEDAISRIREKIGVAA